MIRRQIRLKYSLSEVSVNLQLYIRLKYHSKLMESEIQQEIIIFKKESYETRKKAKEFFCFKLDIRHLIILMDNSQDLNRDTKFDNQQENLELLRLSDPPIYFEPISGVTNVLRPGQPTNILCSLQWSRRFGQQILSYSK